MVRKADSLEELLKNCPENITIAKMMIKTWAKINSPIYQKIACKISGGSDSDIMLDLVWKCDKDNKVDYIWYDTGLEYQATRDHIQYLEKKYGIEIKREKAFIPIPLSSKKYGQPFLSKRVSDYIGRLQKHHFCWEDEPYEVLIQKYPHCQTALQWWCNTAKSKQFCIAYHVGLKEYLIENHPDFPVSCKCCVYAKKRVGDHIMETGHYDLDIIGVRKAEKGTRATAYKSCFDRPVNDWTNGDVSWDTYRPLFWLKNEDKRQYEIAYGIQHSACYWRYGLKRTGCVGCPLGRNVQEELSIIEIYEPKFYAAVEHTFGETYAFTERFNVFRQRYMKKAA